MDKKMRTAALALIDKMEAMGEPPAPANSWTGTIYDGKRCPLCGHQLHERRVHNSLSRVDNATFICNDCGMREAMITTGQAPHRVCLYLLVEGVVALISENSPGYTPWLKKPVVHDWVSEYIAATNAKLGHSEQDVTDIACSSIFW